MNLTYIKEPWECYTFENFLSPDRWKTIRELAQIELDNSIQVLENSQITQETAQRNLAKLLNLSPSISPIINERVVA